jgi:hypothetical protein
MLADLVTLEEIATAVALPTLARWYPLLPH